jgi:hypothetical protein
VDYIEQVICPKFGGKTCLDRAAKVATADYIDIDFDTISQALVITTFHSAPSGAEAWNEQIGNEGGNIQVEVGVLASMLSIDPEPESLSLGGFLTVIGEDDEPSKWG